MPLYEYQCDACGHRFETIQKFSDPPPTECPKCGGTVRKLQSAPAIQFKGSGWYITDYARKDAGASSDSATSESKADSKKASKDDGKTSETKAADDKADKKTEKKSDAAPAPSDNKTS
jgi:putative FmdB family regulatory protein